MRNNGFVRHNGLYLFKTIISIDFQKSTVYVPQWWIDESAISMVTSNWCTSKQYL